MSELRRLNDLRVVDLKAELESRGLDKNGNKAQLLDRLSDALKKDGLDPAVFEFPAGDATPKKPKKSSINKLFGLSKAENSEESMCDDTEGDEDTGGAGETETNGKENEEESMETGEPVVKKEVDADMDDMNLHVQDLDYNEDVNASGSAAVGASGGLVGANGEEMVVPEPDQVEPKCPFTVEDTIKLHAAAHPDGTGALAGSQGTPKGSGDNLSRIDSVSMIVHAPEDNLDEDEVGAVENMEDADDTAFAEEDASANLGQVEPAAEETEEAGDGKDAQDDVEMKDGDEDGKKVEEGGAQDSIVAAASNEENDSPSAKVEEKKSDDKKVAKPGGEKSGGKGLWISGLSSTIRAADLKTAFSKYGRVTVAKVITSQKGGPKYFGFVTMSTADEASKCIQHLHRTDLKGRMISIERRDSIDGALKKLSGASGAAAKRTGGTSKAVPVKSVKHKAAGSTAKKEVRKPDEKEKSEKPSSEKKAGGSEKRGTTHSRSRRSHEPEKHRRIQRPLRPPVRVGPSLRGGGRGGPPPRMGRTADPLSRRRIAPPPDRARAIVNRYRNDRPAPMNAMGRGHERRGPPPPRDARAMIQQRGNFPPRDVRAPPPPEGEWTRQQLLEKFHEQELVHQRREEELKLQRERERIRFEREKLEREKLELQQLRLTQQTLQSNYATISGLGNVAGGRGDLRGQIGQPISPPFDVIHSGGGGHGGIPPHPGEGRGSRHSTGGAGYQGGRPEPRESRQSLPSARPRDERRGNSERDRPRHGPPSGRGGNRAGEEGRGPVPREIRGKRPAPPEPAVIDYRHGQRHGGGHGSGGQGGPSGGNSRSERRGNSSGRSGGRDHRMSTEGRGMRGDRDREERGDRSRGGGGAPWPPAAGIAPVRGEREERDRSRGGASQWPPTGPIPSGGGSRHQTDRRSTGEFYAQSRSAQPGISAANSWSTLQAAPTPQFPANIQQSWTGRGVPSHIPSGGAGIWPQPTAQLLSGSLPDSRYEAPSNDRFDAYKYVASSLHNRRPY